ncbi:GAF domain-containing protein [Streptomyces sp. NPDC048357]|uniref:GAF domain-containing protein n=1 Tax=Streptomyces sp. NPDC048357 TaxID=3154719 RepID=UPI003440FE79
MDPVRARALRKAGVHSMMVVPLAARGVVLGLVCFYRAQCPEAYEDDDLALAVQLAARTAVCWTTPGSTAANTPPVSSSGSACGHPKYLRTLRWRRRTNTTPPAPAATGST